MANIYYRFIFLGRAIRCFHHCSKAKTYYFLSNLNQLVIFLDSQIAKDKAFVPPIDANWVFLENTCRSKITNKYLKWLKSTQNDFKVGNIPLKSKVYEKDNIFDKHAKYHKPFEKGSGYKPFEKGRE